MDNLITRTINYYKISVLDWWQNWKYLHMISIPSVSPVLQNLICELEIKEISWSSWKYRNVFGSSPILSSMKVAKGSLFSARGYKLQLCLVKICAFVREMILCEYMKLRIFKLQKKQRKKRIGKMSCCQWSYQYAAIEGDISITDSYLILRRAKLNFIAQMKLQILN